LTMLGVYQVIDQKSIYTFRKRGVFYFSRRVPSSLQARFDISPSSSSRTISMKLW
jgi:hypothetical protein